MAVVAGGTSALIVLFDDAPYDDAFLLAVTAGCLGLGAAGARILIYAQHTLQRRRKRH